MSDVYRERSHLLALLSRLYPSHCCPVNDPEPGYQYAVCIHFPFGQGSWHLADRDFFDLFNHLEVTESDWDGHTTEDKYRRIQEAVGCDEVG